MMYLLVKKFFKSVQTIWQRTLNSYGIQNFYFEPFFYFLTRSQNVWYASGVVARNGHFVLAIHVCKCDCVWSILKVWNNFDPNSKETSLWLILHKN